MDTGAEPITDPTERSGVKRQARLVQLKAVVTSAVVTAIIAMM